MCSLFSIPSNSTVIGSMFLTGTTSVESLWVHLVRENITSSNDQYVKTPFVRMQQVLQAESQKL
jgi:hypothetical protein